MNAKNGRGTASLTQTQDLLQWLQQQRPPLNPIHRTEPRFAVIYFGDTSPSVCVHDFPLPALDMEGTTANEAAGGETRQRPDGQKAGEPKCPQSERTRTLSRVDSRNNWGRWISRANTKAAKPVEDVYILWRKVCTAVLAVDMSGLVKAVLLCFWSCFVLKNKP